MSPEKMLEIATSMGDERRQPSFADMSSAQRSASMDNVVRQVEALTAQLKALTARHEHTLNCYQALVSRLGELGIYEHDIETMRFHSSVATRLYALETVTAQRWNLPLWNRLRWLLIGR
jgi:hypothetical protein